jgi:hypothetical protein
MDHEMDVFLYPFSSFYVLRQSFSAHVICGFRFTVVVVAGFISAHEKTSHARETIKSIQPFAGPFTFHVVGGSLREE